MSVSYWQDLNPKEKVKADIAIIGAGIAGVSTAYWLRREDPNLKIALIDRQFLASGASGRNAGFITCGSVEHFNRMVGTWGEEKALEIWQYGEKNLELLKQEILTEKNREKIGFEQKGSFSLASSEGELKELSLTASMMKERGVQVEYLEEKAVGNRLGVSGFIGGIKYIDDASVHPALLVQEILNAAQGSHLQCFFEREIYSIQESADHVLLKGRSLEVSAEAVILATNAYSYQLNSFFADKISPTRGQILATAPVKKVLEGPCYAHFVLDYFRQLPSGEIIIGGFRQLQKDTEVGVSDETTSVIQEALEEFIQTHLPFAKGVPITHRWSGIMGFSRDGQPLIGQLPTSPRVYYLGGFTAHGMGLGFHAGKNVVDLLMGREIPAFLNGRRFK